MTKVIASITVDQLRSIVKANGLSVERSSGGKGKSKGAPKKADYQNAIINADPLCMIGSLVHRAIRRHIKVDELIVLMENAGLSKQVRRLSLLSDYWLILEVILVKNLRKKGNRRRREVLIIMIQMSMDVG